MKSINLLIILSILGVSALLTGCKTLQSKDLTPTNRQISVHLPLLEPLIDLNSFEKAYNGGISSTNQGVLSGAQQDYANYFVNTAATVFSKDMKQNIIQNLNDNNGYIVCIITNSGSKSPTFWGVFGGCTLCIPWLLGAPIYQYENEVWIDVEIKNIKNEIITTYNGHGKYKVSNGFYYGYSGTSFGAKAVMEAIKRALDEVKQKISANRNTLNIALNKSMEEISQERLLSKKQSSLEPDTFLNANKMFDEKDYAQSIELYNSVLAKYPYHTAALLNRARAKSELGDNVSAIKDLTRIIELDSKNVDAYYYKGVFYGNLLELNASVYNYNKAIELAPDMAQAFLMRAAAEEDLTLNYNAADDYRKVLSINPNLTFAKERLTLVQDRISQNIIQQQKQAEQDRINKLNALSSALNTLSNSLNMINSSSSTTTNTSTSNFTSPSNKANVNNEQVKCTYCNGTGSDPYPSYGPSFGLDRASNVKCPICGKYENHYHKTCIRCKGKGYITKFTNKTQND